MLSDGRDYQGCSLPLCFRKHYLGHYPGIRVIEVTYRFVGQKEIERLTESTYQRHTLLLAEGHVSEPLVHTGGYSHCVEPFPYRILLLEVRELVFYHHILHRSEFGEEAQLLKQLAQVITAQVHPIAVAVLPYVSAVEKNTAGIVLPIAVKERAQAAFACTARGFDEICPAAFYSDFLKPHLALDIRAGSEDFRKYVLQMYLIHSSYLSTFTL